MEACITYRGLRTRDGVVDAPKQILHLTIELQARFAIALLCGEFTGEHSLALLGDIFLPVADIDIVIELAGAARLSSKLLIVDRAVVGVSLSIHDEVDIARLGLGGLEAGVRPIKRGNKSTMKRLAT